MKRVERVWEVPQPVSTCEVDLGDGTVTVLRRYGNADGRRLILSHGNGLAIDLYYPFWSLLVDDFDLVLYDIRNHGWNRLGPIGRHNVPVFIADLHRILAAIDERFGAKPRIGVYHSLSALIALLSLSSIMTEQVAAEEPGFSDLVLYDPPALSAERQRNGVRRGGRGTHPPHAQPNQPVQVPRGLRGPDALLAEFLPDGFPARAGSWPPPRSEGRRTARTTCSAVPRSTRPGWWSTRAAMAAWWTSATCRAGSR